MLSVSRSDASHPPSGCFPTPIRKHSFGCCKASARAVDDVRTTRPRHRQQFVPARTVCTHFLAILQSCILAIYASIVHNKY